MNRSFALALAALFLFLLSVNSFSAQRKTEYGAGELFVSEDGLWRCEITGESSVSLYSGIMNLSAYNGDETVVKVPSKIDGYTLVSIGKYAFCDCERIVNIVLPDTVKEIGLGAFNNCPSLLQVVIPESVTKIDENIFDEQTSVKIASVKGSAAQVYAKNHGIQFVEIGTSSKAKTGWKNVSGCWFYYNEDGSMQFGWKKIKGKWYYFDDSGIMKTGWKHLSGEWYFFDSTGAMQTGWKSIAKKWYFFNSGGKMRTGWLASGGKWYYLKSDGAMAIGWQKVKDVWYYFNSKGAMLTGWQKISNKWYYLDSGGKMLTGRQVIDGKVYYFDSQGRWIKLDKDSQKIVYITKTGSKYHYDPTCGNREYYTSTLSDALRRGLTPCEKCVHA